MASGLAAAHPDRALAGGVVEVAVFGHREHLAAAVLDAAEGFRITVAVMKVKNYLFSLRNTLFLFVWFSIHDQMEL